MKCIINNVKYYWVKNLYINFRRKDFCIVHNSLSTTKSDCLDWSVTRSTKESLTESEPQTPKHTPGSETEEAKHVIRTDKVHTKNKR